MTQDMKTKWGKVSISDEVIATIAGVAATEGYGIVGMASRKIKDGISELLGRENLSRGVEVSVADDKLIIKLFIAVGYGVRISEVARNVQESVRYSVQNMTGLEVSRVDIVVQGVKVGDSH